MAMTNPAAREDPIRVRDAALHRITVTRRWMIVAVAGLTAGLAALVSALLPGKSLGAKSNVATVASSPTPVTVTPGLPAPASASQLGVGAPGQSSQSLPPPPVAPQPAPAQSAPAQSAPAYSAPAPAVSGGS